VQLGTFERVFVLFGAVLIIRLHLIWWLILQYFGAHWMVYCGENSWKLTYRHFGVSNGQELLLNWK
jgi:hypothetical protein